ncbi:hypothetical protein ABL78_4762 [Leptomonas seymouri]|uniref:Uncharacterized protein n=1 Tax=Leptomonas seymouri TaxID=5684 RepID=A0A0N1I4F8_LEPSE|nr:hypothetical protein ABL78_4762 [Leptomonas seymouri]|eukprot:KPI86173.1 hypothetical protein ABL78_4762 [Leptomonas seymouri]
MTSQVTAEASSASQRSALERSALWHLAFYSQLAAHSRAIPALLDASSHDAGAAAVAFSASLLESLGYTKAGSVVQSLLNARMLHVSDSRVLNGMGQPHSWLDVFSARVRHHAAQLVSSKREVASILVRVVQEAQLQYESEMANARSSHNTSPCDALFVALAEDYLEHASADVRTDVQYSRHISLFQLAPLATSLSSPSSSASTTERRALVRQQRQWYEARLYAALACAASITVPGPLARLLVAYAHADDGRLQTAADDNLSAHLRVARNGDATCADSRISSEAADEQQREPSALAEATEQARVRLSGVVAGVLEYALYAAHISSSAVTAVLNAMTHSAPTALTAALARPFASEGLPSFSNVSPSAALLLVQLTEECGYYQQTASTAASGAKDTASESTAAAASTAIVHAMQELLFTIVLGCGTQGLQSRPEPVTSKKPTSAAAAPASLASGLTAAAAAVPMLVTTIRGVSMPEADATAEELFPSLVQQLGMEWLWSPLLRYLSILDKRQSSAAASSDAAGRKGFTTPHHTHLPVRWSSNVLMDAVLLSVAQKTYPQRLLNILPGSYERLLKNLNLLPPMQPQGDDTAEDALASRAAQAALFDMPAYYAEPAAALVSYFQRVGVSGQRLDEVGRILMAATSSHPMLVRLKAQAPPLTEAGEDEYEKVLAKEAGTEIDGVHSSADGERKVDRRGTAAPTHAYALTRERVDHLIARYRGEVLLAAVVVYTQLRIPSQVQQLMRTLAPLFLKLQLDWRTHHDGSITSWFLQHSSNAGTGTRSVRFSSEAAVLLDKVGYEFYPLEWLPAVASSVCAASSASAELSNSLPPLPYSLCAAVGHQFHLRLRGTPLGSSGDVTLRHPAGPRSSVVMPSADIVSLLPGTTKSTDGEAEATATAWRRAERFLEGLLQVCYLDSKTSSTELEGTLAVSSTRRVLTTSDGPSQGGYDGSAVVGGTSLIASADIASQRLRSLLQQHAVMNAMWGPTRTSGKTAAPQNGSRAGQSQHRRGQKRSRCCVSPETERTEAQSQLRAMRQVLASYGASSFDTTVEAADFLLTVAQSFLPSTAGMAAVLPSAASTPREEKSDAVLRSALEWSRAAVASPASRAGINMLLQQQKEAFSGGSAPPRLSLVSAYNSASLDTAWLARRTLRQVPRRLWEKVELQQTLARTLAQREAKWVSQLPGSSAAAAAGNGEKEVVETYCVDPLLLEQWTQWVRVWQQLGLADAIGGGDSFGASLSTTAGPKSAEEMSCAQWLWYSPHFTAEWSRS